jgi:hypothetical protein
LFTFKEVGMQVSLVTMSHPSPRTVALSPCLLLDIKDSLLLLDIKDSLKEDVRLIHGRFFDGELMGF